MTRFHGAFQTVALVVALFCAGLPAAQASLLAGTGLAGTVKSSDGKPMEGVAVSARAQGKTVTTSVYTNQDGEYFFPDSLSAGQYQIWAQAVGFQMARLEGAISSGKTLQQDFSLQPLRNFEKQLSGTEWENSLPTATAEDRRMHKIFNYNCTSCHVSGFVLTKRFDSAGWGIILDTMIEHYTNPGARNRKMLQSYKEELVEYLTRVRGPKQYPLNWKPFPRPVGEAARIVVTEYDLPRVDQPDYLWANNGTDWSAGIPSRYDLQLMHDAVVGKDGNIYFSDADSPERTVGKIDPETGRVTSYMLPDKNGVAVGTHGAAVAPDGTIWLTNQTERTMLQFDPRTEKFQRYPRATSMARAGGTIAVDSQGDVWTSSPNGALRLNPQTGKYTAYKSVTPGGGPYGITIDAEDNVWVAQLQSDRLTVVNSRTGEVSEVVLPPLDEEISAKDREIGERNGSTNNSAPLFQKGPRRLGADPNGDAVWVAEYFAGRLARIDIHTLKVTEYKVPHRYSHPYAVVVDKNHMVWLCLLNSNRIAKFNPFTEQFTEYPLPNLGTNIRFIDVDNRTDPPTVWVGYSGSNKIASVKFRTNPASTAAVR